ncbi:chorismate-binding protein [Ekhidna sp.]
MNLDQGDILLNKLQKAGVAFAAWKMPNDVSIQLIISLNNTVKSNDLQLSEIGAGFLINEYADNHPIKPYYISADIVVKDNQTSINPNVKSSEIDEFVKQMNDPSFTKTVDSSEKSIFSSNEFEEAVQQAILEIKDGSFEKIVLSRYKDEPLPAGFSIWEFFQTICSTYKNAFCSISHIPGKRVWIGASPELLISDSVNQFRTVSLAGTKALEEGQELSEIAWTQKEIEEQALVSRYIINCFKKIRLREFHEHGPKTIQAGNLAHLKTEFIVDYSELGFDELADQMLELLHPTSAVCGMPIENTKPWIKEVEKYNREFYSGFLGPINFEGSTDLFVNLRCMRLSENKIRFYAGAGITEDSIPKKEYLETEMKMNVLKRLL